MIRQALDGKHINRRACLSRRLAVKRVKDSVVNLLLRPFISPVQFFSQEWSLELNGLSLLFLHMPRSEDRLCAPLGTAMLAFDVSWEILNKGSKYSSKPLHRTTQKAEGGLYDVEPIRSKRLCVQGP